MLQYDPARRPTASDVLGYPYFTTEDPAPRQATEYVVLYACESVHLLTLDRLRDLEGDWHEFESKALRKENERRDKEARRANNKELHRERDREREREREKEKEKRRASAMPSTNEREVKRPRPSSAASAAMDQT